METAVQIPGKVEVQMELQITMEKVDLIHLWITALETPLETPVIMTNPVTAAITMNPETQVTRMSQDIMMNMEITMNIDG